ncbi:hypothetical protein TM4_89 [Mycobacterium phage TM4]|uniref:Uncharacterized protein n=1 Tax=Mycobacterium phage TM4 TaxID=88870 RepID=Q9ZWZ1_BPMT4|nr:hypothetical protein TM4_gp89 [Mycobacterium phage TM4]AAD17654.1 hypothetical protein TM4_89 [Mycobacterium phage TM4]AGK85765.1 hypothetical protein 33D_0083 [Mycobacterium phage 33D]
MHAGAEHTVRPSVAHVTAVEALTLAIVPLTILVAALAAWLVTRKRKAAAHPTPVERLGGGIHNYPPDWWLGVDRPEWD